MPFNQIVRVLVIGAMSCVALSAQAGAVSRGPRQPLSSAITRAGFNGTHNNAFPNDGASRRQPGPHGGFSKGGTTGTGIGSHPWVHQPPRRPH